jgi:hypothetical protein
MRSRRAARQLESRTERPTTYESRSQATCSTQHADDPDSFPEIQADSGRRMRPIVAELYGETE